MGDTEKFDELAHVARWRLERLQALAKEGKLDAPIAVEPAGAPEGFLADETSSYFYRPGELLSAVDAVDRVEGALREMGVEVRERVYPREGSGFVKLELATPQGDRELGVPEVVRRLRGLFGDDADQTPLVGPNHLFFPAPWNTAGPATEPQLPRGEALQARDPGAGKGVKVAIIDTGLLKAPLPDSLRHDITFGPDATEDPDYDGNGFIDPVAGHGTFIAGLIRQIAPATSLHVEQMNDKAGIFAESDLAERLHDVLDLEPDIINLSLGGHTDIGAAPVALAEVWARLEHQDRTIVVAAAGNSASSERFWPAASAFALGVGALGVDGRRAWFSNYGDWVDVWAPGEHLLSAYAAGSYLPRSPAVRLPVPVSRALADAGRRLGDVLPTGWTRLADRLRGTGALTFDGQATWSGTSFATPLVVGAIAALMSARGISARQAQQELAGQSLRVVDLAAFGTT